MTFEEEVKRLLNIHRKVDELDTDTSLVALDSLTVTELCVLAEEHHGIELEFGEVKKAKTYGELDALILSKKKEVQ